MLLATLAAIALGTVIMYVWTLIIRNELRSLIFFASDTSALQAGFTATSQRLHRSPLAEVRNLVSSFQSMMDELAEKNAAIDALRQYYEKIMSQAPGVLFTLRIDTDDSNEPRIGPCTYMSGSVKQHFGYDVVEALRSHWWKSSVHPTDWPRVRREMDELLDTGRKTIQYRLKLADGKYRWVYSELSVAFDTTLTAKEIIGFLSDHEEAHKAAERLSQSERLASLGQMASGMAHELAQPLNIIGMTAQNVRMHLQGGHADKEYLLNKTTRIIDQIDRAGKIIRNLRIFGKSATIPLVPISGLKVINDVRASMEEQLGKHGICIAQNTPRDECMMLGDETMVEQILVNLVNNARDAYGLDLSGAEAGVIRIQLRYSDSGKEGIIIVEDDAGGIDDTIMPNIFSPFVTSKPPGKGMGLGLSLSKVMANDMGGDLLVENTSTGARFSLTLRAGEL
jgi:signal transduction histidine kinase